MEAKVRPAQGQPSKYDQPAKLYADLYEAMAASAAFLPWHRHYLHVFEQELRQIDPTVTLPYWDWSEHSQLQDTLPGFPEITVQSIIKTQSLCYTYR